MALARIDVAIGPDGLTALLPGRESAEWIPARLDVSRDDSAGAMSEAFARLDDALRGDLGIAAEDRPRFVVRAALLPPLSEARLVDLPGLRPEEIEPVLRRDATRHFIGGNRDRVITAMRVENAQPVTGRADVFAAAAPRNLLDALRIAVEMRGWELERVVPASAAWVAALRKASPPVTEPGGVEGVRLVLAVVDGTAHVIRLTGDRIDRIRRFLASDLGGIVEAAGPVCGSAMILADGGERTAIATCLKETGWVIVQPATQGSAAVCAAREAGDALPEIVPDFIAERRSSRNTVLTKRLFAAAILILLTAAAVHYWGTARTHEAILRERADLQAEVAPAMAARDSLDRMSARLDELQTLEAQATGWASSLVELSLVLPPETYLTSLRAAGDTVVLEAVGGRAGEALAALAASPSLEDVRLEGAIQRELERGTTSRERFTISGIMVRRATALPALRPLSAVSTTDGLSGTSFEGGVTGTPGDRGPETAGGNGPQPPDGADVEGRTAVQPFRGDEGPGAAMRELIRGQVDAGRQQAGTDSEDSPAGDPSAQALPAQSTPSGPGAQ